MHFYPSIKITTCHEGILPVQKKGGQVSG